MGENSSALAVVVMAAGKGTRMKSELPKVLHPVAGVPLLGHVLRTAAQLAPSRSLVIVGHGAEAVRAALPEGVEAVLQAEQLGTGHALQQCAPALEGFQGQVLILSGDVPLVKPESLKALLAAKTAAGAAAAMMVADFEDPTGYGRVLRQANGRVDRIVEHKDASPEQRAVREINLGLYLADWPALNAALTGLKAENAQGEYYLTDAIGALAASPAGVVAVVTPDAWEGAGVNTRAELAGIELEYRKRTAARWMAEGVGFEDPTASVVGPDVVLAPDVWVGLGARLLGHTRVGAHSLVGAHSHLENAILGEGVQVLQSFIIDSEVGDGTHVGPFAHLRMHAKVGKKVRLGNFVEVKNSTLGEGTKAAHLAYLGDATLGAKVNVGCGVVTVNYDGKNKHRTVVGDGAFVGSNANLIAPVTVHEGGYVAAGSTITDDVPAGALALGRARQVNKEGWVAARKAREGMAVAAASATGADATTGSR